MKNKCETCQCIRCDNDTCKWVRCQKGQSTEECFQKNCTAYDNLEEDVDEGFFDGYED